MPIDVYAPTAPSGETWDSYLTRMWNSPFMQGPGEYVSPEYLDWITPGGPADEWHTVSQAIPWGPLHPDIFNYTDPQAREIASKLIHNATLKDNFSVWGDQFSTALMALGLAAGGAAAFGGFSATPAVAGGVEALAAPLPTELGSFSGMALAPEGAAALGAGGATTATGASTTTGGISLPTLLKTAGTIASLGGTAAGIAGGGSSVNQPGSTNNLGGFLGPSGAGITGSLTQQGLTQSPDSLTQLLNLLRYEQVSGGASALGGLETLLPQLYTTAFPQSPIQDLSSLGYFTSIEPGLSPTDWYARTQQDIDPSAKAMELGNYARDNRAVLSQLQRQNEESIYSDLAPRLLGSGRDYFREILSPEITNSMSLMGLARSGANEEAQAKGAASISLPISQLIAQLVSQNRQAGTGYQAQNLSSAFGENAGLQRQYLQNLYGLNQQYPNVDTALRDARLTRLGEGMRFGDYPRLQAQAGLGGVLSPYLSALNATPYTPGTSTSGSTSTSPGLLSSLGGGLTQVGGALSLAKSLGWFGQGAEELGTFSGDFPGA